MAKISPISFSSCFSFGHGAVSPAAMAAELARHGFSTLPITDELSCAGYSEAVNVARNSNLQLLAGIRYSLAPDDYLLFYPDDLSGFSSLNRSVSTRNFSTPANPSQRDNITGWLKLSGAGRIIISGPIACSLAETAFATGWTCFINLPVAGALALQKQACEVARHFGMRTIIAPDLICSCQEDIDAVRLIRAFSSGALLTDVPTFKPVLPDNMRRFADLAGCFPEAAACNHEFVSQTSWMPGTGTLHMPRFSPSPQQSVALLAEIARAGLQRRYTTVTPIISSRFEYELKTIAELGFADYFLVVNDITRKARELGHRVLGRGSAANSLISYALDFTQVDPVEHKLYFERFLNSARKSPPDIDLDFSWRIRDQIYEFLLERWGSDRVALISTHISLRGRGAIRETGKTLGFKNDDISYASSLIGSSSIAGLLHDPDKNARFKAQPERLAMLKPLLTMAARIEGIPTHFSIHAGGVVIAPNSLYEFTATVPGSKVLPLTQLEMRGIENFGLVKLDLLSQRALGVYSDLMKLASQGKTVTAPPADPMTLEKDPAVAAALADGRTMGVFYIESPGMRGLLQKLHCNTYTGLIAASSIIRPGVAESGMMQEYIRRHHQPHGWKPVHPLMGELLSETFGVMVYQEDVMKVAHHIAGFTLAEADVLRRAMSGKERSTDQMQTARDRFLDGAAARGIDNSTASEIWRQISSFCGYAFCKAHSASYAVLSLELLWFKQHFPGPFMAAVINNRGGFYGPQAYVSEARRLGLTLLPPDVNLSEAEFTCSGSQLRTGLGFITSIAGDTVARIISERGRQAFSSLEDFLSRVRPAADEIENLISSGALREFGSAAACRWREKLMPRNSLFCEPLTALPPGALAQASPAETSREEIKSLGFCVSGHPLDIFTSPPGICPAAKLGAKLNLRVRVFGLLIATKSVTTSRGARMKFLTLEDKTGLIEIVFFPDAWQKNQINLDYTSVLEISGRVVTDQGSLTLHGETLKKH